MNTKVVMALIAVAGAFGAGAIVLLTGPSSAPPSVTPTSSNNSEVAKPSDSVEQDAPYTAFDNGQYLTALSLAQARAARGDPQAHTLVARIYEQGVGVGKDDIAAARWYARAAELGDVPAMLAYGRMLAEGRGTGKDAKAAAELFEKAAATGDPLANYNLGMLFINGTGKPENPIRGAQHIRYAAEKGIAQAQYDLGALYQQGTGVPNDGLEAARWISRAAAQGLTAAQYDYAVMLLRGFGLKQDESKAISYLKSAAENGVPGAQNRLAHIYFEGVAGIEKSTQEAAKWRLIAKAQGVDDDKLDLMIKSLPDPERIAAQKAAQEWRDKKLLIQ